MYRNTWCAYNAYILKGAETEQVQGTRFKFSVKRVNMNILTLKLDKTGLLNNHNHLDGEKADYDT